MNLDWQWQQENVALRKENAELKRKLAVYLVGKVAVEKAESGKIFSKKQMKFSRAFGTQRPARPSILPTR